jgi:hypothetical protein
MGLREEHVEALVEETVAGYENVLPPDAVRALKTVLHAAFEAHPVMSELVSEHAPREHADASGTQPVDEDAVAEADEHKRHG